MLLFLDIWILCFFSVGRKPLQAINPLFLNWKKILIVFFLGFFQLIWSFLVIIDTVKNNQKKNTEKK